jgi:DNA-binding Lrp family transcriptional regulator
MVIDDRDRDLLEALAAGLPLVPRPYAVLGAAVGLEEAEAIASVRRLIDIGVIKRFGVIVRHRELGYRANAMVVWNVPDSGVAEAGRRLAALPYVTLCYRRPRVPPEWPYNLFCMIHGRSRPEVEALVEQATEAAALASVPRSILFSRRCFKQRGARFKRPPIMKPGADPEMLDGHA